jgi:NDP-sugar pyrophosphorylase family protein
VQAVILAGGLGTRLRPITETIPKPMVPVAGVPYLEHQLKELAKQNIQDVILLTGYLGEQIEQYFGNGSSLGLSLRYSQEPSPLGTGGAIRLGLNLLADAFLIIYGDSYLPVDYRAVCTALLDAPSADGLVVVYDNRLSDTSVTNNIDLDGSGYVNRYEKDGVGLSYVEAGVLAFRRHVIESIPPGQVVSLEKEIFPQLIAKHRLLGYPTRTRFYDIGTPDRLRAFEDLLRQPGTRSGA